MPASWCGEGSAGLNLKWVPRWMLDEDLKVPSRQPASTRPSLITPVENRPLPFRLFVQAEPRWYREPASLPAKLSELRLVPLMNDRGPAHPSDGMWRVYDSPALSR
jgi:hypothetical protein